MELKCIIIDDEQPARELLENYCARLEHIKVLGSYKSAIEAHSVLKATDIDLLLLDIQMPDISGIDFLRLLQPQHTKVIFTTAYRDYALDGYELDVVDYLLKPIEFHRFFKAIEKVKILQRRQDAPEIGSGDPRYLSIKSGKRMYRVPTKDISYIKSENEYVKYVTKTMGSILEHGALKDLECQLSPIEGFIRVHRSYIINTAFIAYVEGNRIMIEGEFIPISERYKSSFFKLWQG
ncbi:Two-component system response regulator [Tenacibaculum litopenaei]|uniref:LytR/AlgR family response regulator transcription factor n=1 Tax=Tenacibaculum litopenaei TaxID=396016 RepID=UPI00389346C7